jgi:sugar phosphate permease
LQGISSALCYLLVFEFFEEKYKVKAFFAFSVAKQLGDSVRYLTPILISATGWRNTWIIGGGFSVFVGLLIVFTV